MSLLHPWIPVLHVCNSEILKVFTVMAHGCFSKLIPVPFMVWPDCKELYSPLTIMATNSGIVRTIIQNFGLHSGCCDVRLTKDDWITPMVLHKEVLLHFHITYLGFDSRTCTIKIASLIVCCPQHPSMVDINWPLGLLIDLP